MNVLLLRELGQGIDAARMVADELYARDVLLVCDAMRPSELAPLAKRYRLTAAAAEGERGANGTNGTNGTNSTAAHSGFSASRFLSSIFGTASSQDPPPDMAAARAPSRSWFGRPRSPADGK